MAITINGSPLSLKPKKKKAGHTKPKDPQMSLEQPGRLRVAHCQWLLGRISHSAFYARLHHPIPEYRFPKPDGHDPRPYWKTETIKKLLDE